jgi:hypothetical protein
VVARKWSIAGRTKILRNGVCILVTPYFIIDFKECFIMIYPKLNDPVLNNMGTKEFPGKTAKTYMTINIDEDILGTLRKMAA